MQAAATTILPQPQGEPRGTGQWKAGDPGKVDPEKAAAAAAAAGPVEKKGAGRRCGGGHDGNSPPLGGVGERFGKKREGRTRPVDGENGFQVRHGHDEVAGPTQELVRKNPLKTLWG